MLSLAGPILNLEFDLISAWKRRRTSLATKPARRARRNGGAAKLAPLSATSQALAAPSQVATLQHGHAYTVLSTVPSTVPYRYPTRYHGFRQLDHCASIISSALSII